MVLKLFAHVRTVVYFCWVNVLYIHVLPVNVTTQQKNGKGSSHSVIATQSWSWTTLVNAHNVWRLGKRPLIGLLGTRGGLHSTITTWYYKMYSRALPP